MFQRFRERATQAYVEAKAKSTDGPSAENIGPAGAGSNHGQDDSALSAKAAENITGSETATEGSSHSNVTEDARNKNDALESASNHGKEQLENAKKVFSRWRTQASKAMENSAHRIADALNSSSHHGQSSAKHSSSPSVPVISDHSESSSFQDKLSMATLPQIQEDDVLPTDPEIIRLNAQIQQLRFELNSLKDAGNNTHKRRQQEVGNIRGVFNGKSRELWFKIQKMKTFGGLNEYKAALKRCSLPAHDNSSTVINCEAQIMRAQHQGAILDRQLGIVHQFQQSMIDYLYTNALPEIKADRELASMVGRSQVDKMLKAEQNMVALFEECLGLQRKIMAKYKLRELEASRHIAHDHDEELARQEKEHLLVMAGDIPAMERDAELRDSAKERLRQRMQEQHRRVERRRSRDEDFIKMTEAIEQVEKSALEKAQEQIKRLSNHSVDLLLNDSDGEKGNDESSNGSAGEFGDESERGTVNQAQAKFGEESERGTVNQAEAEFGEASERGTVNQAEAELGEASERGTVSQAEAESGEESERGTVSQAEAEFGKASERVTVSQAQAQSGEESERDTVSQAQAETEEAEVSTSQVIDKAEDAMPQIVDKSSSNDEAPQDSTSQVIDKAEVQARLRARRASRATENQGVFSSFSSDTSERSESSDVNLSPKSPRAIAARQRARVSARLATRTSMAVNLVGRARTARASVAAAKVEADAADAGHGARTDVLERARATRASIAAGSAESNAAAARTMRPSLGTKAMSSRDIASRRIAAARPSMSALGGSEHRSSSKQLDSSERSTDHRPTSRASLAAGSPEERQARMERMANRRQSSAVTGEAGGSTALGGISEERRAQLRNSRVSIARSNPATG